MPQQLNPLQSFFEFDASHQINEYINNEESYWQDLTEKRALEIFHIAANNVVAYKDFLNKNSINHEKIISIDDFKKYVPIIDKENYLDMYSITELVQTNSWENIVSITSSSGSSGKPRYWPRLIAGDINASNTIELMLQYQFKIKERSTLYVMCFGMGVWSGGDIMSSALKLLMYKGYKGSMISPGTSLDDAISSIKNLSQFYDQTIILGYPPFLKILVDEGEKAGILWKNIHPKFVYAGELPTVSWKEYMCKKVDSKDKYFDFNSHYGSSESGATAFEFPIAGLLRDICNNTPGLNETLFDTNFVPTIVQYNPALRYIECVNELITVTVLNGIPLVRYNTKDIGKTFTFSELINKFESNNINISLQLKEANIQDYFKLPFFSVCCREDLVVTLYGLNIYPEHIKDALLDKDLNESVTGRFYVTTEYDINQNQYLQIRVELRRSVIETKELKDKASSIIVEYFRKLNSEYRKLYNSLSEAASPQIIFQEFEDKKYFSTNKQKYISPKKK